MMNKKTIVAAAAAVILLPLNANALDFLEGGSSHFSYNYAEALYTDVDGIDAGIMGRGSYDVTENIAVVGSYLSAGDYTALSIGAAYHTEASFLDDADLVLHVSYESVEWDLGEFCWLGSCTSLGVDDSGLTFGSTIRYELQDNLEVFGDVSYTTVFDGDLLLTGGAVWSFSDALSVVGSYKLADINTLSLGVRYSFGE